MKIIVTTLLGLIGQVAVAQVVKDLDGDVVADTVRYDPSAGRIVCRLSGQGFQPVLSRPELSDELNADVRATRSGFEFFVSHMRAGSASQFRYEPRDGQIRLIGMSRYEFGPANNDGSGKSSVNLLTNDYLGEWNYYDSDQRKLRRLPAIRTKLYFPKTYLAAYDGRPQAQYEEQCNALYRRAKQRQSK